MPTIASREVQTRGQHNANYVDPAPHDWLTLAESVIGEIRLGLTSHECLTIPIGTNDSCRSHDLHSLSTDSTCYLPQLASLSVSYSPHQFQQNDHDRAHDFMMPDSIAAFTTRSVVDCNPESSSFGLKTDLDHTKNFRKSDFFSIFQYELGTMMSVLKTAVSVACERSLQHD